MSTEGAPRKPASSGGAPAEEEIARLIEAAGNGCGRALADLFTAVYPELLRLARSQRACWRGDEMLCATALVHEAYLRLSRRPSRWQNRAHFLNAASRAMRHILVDERRKQTAAKRGGERFRVSVDSVPLVTEDVPEDVLALHEALQRLGELDGRRAHVIACRFFAGLDIEETAETLGVSTRTVKRDWRNAQAWLYHELTRSQPGFLTAPATTHA